MADTVVLEPEWLRASRMRSDASVSDKGGAGSSTSDHSPGDMGPKYSRDFMIKVFRSLGDFPMPEHLRIHDYITPPSGLKLPLIADCPLTEEEKSPASINSTALSRANSTFGRGRRSSVGRGTGRTSMDIRRPDGAPDGIGAGIHSMSMGSFVGANTPGWRDAPPNREVMFWGAPANDVITRASPSIGGIERAHRATSMPLGADERLWERGAPDWRSPDAAQNAETFGADAVEELLANMKASQEAGQRPGMGGNKPILTAAPVASDPGIWDSPVLNAMSPRQSPMAELVNAHDMPLRETRARPATPVGASAPPTPTLGMPPQIWFYKDPNNQIQGPFTNHQMYEWHVAGYFSGSLLLAQTTPENFIPLGTIISLRGGVSPFVPLPPMSHSQDPLPRPGPHVFSSAGSGWGYGMANGPNAAYAPPAPSPHMHVGWGGGMSMDPTAYITPTMLDQHVSLRATQEKIQLLEMELAQHEESERSLRMVQTELYGEQQAQKLARTREEEESDLNAQLELEMERLRLERVEEERQLAELQIAAEAAAQEEGDDGDKQAMDQSCKCPSAEGDRSQDDTHTEPSLKADDALLAATSEKKKKKKKSPTPTAPVASAPAPAPTPVPVNATPVTPSQQHVKPSPAPSSVVKSVPVAPLPPPRSLLEIQEEEERLRKERMKQQEKERSERLSDAIRAEKALKWAEKPVVQPKTMSLAEIQEQEAKLLQERKQREALQQARLMAQMGASEAPIKLDSSKWTAKSVSSTSMSLADIQRQEMAQKAKAVPPTPTVQPAPVPAPTKAVIANVVTANTFWDLADNDEEPMAKALTKSEKKKQKKSAQQPAPTVQQPSVTAVPPSPTSAAPMSQDEFRRWAAFELSGVSAGQDLDCLTFVTLLDEMPSPSKVVEMIQEVLGTGNEAKEFSRAFIERKRVTMQLQTQVTQQRAIAAAKPAPAANVRGVTPPPPISSAWPSLGDGPAATPSSSNQSSGLTTTSKKGKKAKGQKLDLSILGFTVNNTQRMNAGEIQSADDVK